MPFEGFSHCIPLGFRFLPIDLLPLRAQQDQLLAIQKDRRNLFSRNGSFSFMNAECNLLIR